MSDRFSGCDYENVPEGLWEHALIVALGSRYGQAQLAELRAALLALPERRLIRGDLCVAAEDEQGNLQRPEFCAIGAYAYYRRLAKGELAHLALRELVRLADGDEQPQPWDTVWEGQRQGLRYTVAWHVAQLNDDFRGTPEERYSHILHWVNAQLSKS